ncbi:hypothetical protein NHQ30_005849 [Ciborinia camelliae]|nr:hypothetical protein NHQ30_005849 [Ciborinia camelliae]
MGFREKLKNRFKRHGPNKAGHQAGAVNPPINSTVGSTSSSASQGNPATSSATSITSIQPSKSPMTAGQPLSTTPPVDPKELWLKALQNLKAKEPELIEKYSKILLQDATLNVSNGSPMRLNSDVSAQATSNEILIKLAKERLDDFTIPSNKTDDKVENVVKVVIAAKSFVGAALESEPHAALAWAGVSMFLPLLLNPITEKEGCRDGLEQIPSLMHRYALIENSIWNSKATEKELKTAKFDLWEKMVHLYEEVLLFEARAIVHFCGNDIARYLKDALKLNDWKNSFEKIVKIDQQCRLLTEVIDRDLYRNVLEEQNQNTALLMQTLNSVAQEFREQRAWQRTKDDQECLQSFRTGNLYELQKDRNPSRIPGTCKWALEHRSFIDWKAGKGSNVLWVSGDPGSGKSVLSKALIEERLVATDSNTTICYFFFKDISPEQRSPTKALSALLHQLFSSQEHLMSHARDDWGRNKNELPNLASKMWDILERIASDSQTENTVCIIDALDECESSGRKYIIEGLQRLYSDTNTGYKSGIRFLVTSRPYYDIEMDFKHLTAKFPSIRLAGEEETEMIKQEINLVIDAEVKALELPEHVGNHLCQRLQSIEHRTYLWLHLIMETIRYRAKASKQAKIFDKILDSPLPANIDEAYDAILSKSPDPEEATKLLHIVVGASRPLTLEELNIALNINECYDGSQSFEDIELEDLESFPKRIRNLCGLFVSISDSRVYLIHLTAEEFLISKDSSLPATGWKHSLEPSISQSVMAGICVSYLYLSMFSEAETQSQCFMTSTRGQQNMPNQHRFGFLEYAAAHWMTHYKSSAGNIDLQAIIDLCSPTIRRAIWYQAFLIQPPKKFADVAYLVSVKLNVYNCEETSAMSTLMIASSLGLLDVAKTILATPLSKSEVCKYWNDETALNFAMYMADIEMVR